MTLDLARLFALACVTAAHERARANVAILDAEHAEEEVAILARELLGDASCPAELAVAQAGALVRDVLAAALGGTVMADRGVSIQATREAPNAPTAA